MVQVKDSGGSEQQIGVRKICGGKLNRTCWMVGSWEEERIMADSKASRLSQVRG